MTPEQFDCWIEDTESSVCLECGRCGIKADPDTGLCQGCTAKTGDWPEDRSHENGNYFCKCAICGATFRGHKRRVACKRCADGTTRTVAITDQPML